MNQEELQEKMKIQQQVLQIENLAKQYMTKEAIARYGNIKAANQEKSLQIIALIAQLSQSNQITEKLTDDQFKEILRKIEEPKKEIKIIRR